MDTNDSSHEPRDDGATPGEGEPEEPRAGGEASEPGEPDRPAGTDEQPPPPQPPPPVAPAPPPVRPLLRYPDDGPGAGVAAGLGYYFGADPVLFRIAFVLLAFAGGIGILLYLVGWALMPEAAPGSQHAPPPSPGQAAAAGRQGAGGPAARGHAGPPPERALQWVGIGLVVVAGLWLTAEFDFVSPPVLWAAALIVLGVLLFRGDLGRPGTQPPAAPDDRARAGAVPATVPARGGEPPRGTAPREVPPAWGAPRREVPPPAWGGGQPPPAVPPAPAEPPSSLGRLTVGAALLAGGAAALLDTAGAVDLVFRHYAALALLVVGLGLLAGTWWGRSRWLIAVGLVLVPVVLVAGVANAFVTVRGGVGERFFVPREVAEVRETYELFAGQLEVDLTGVDFEGQSVAVRSQVTFGELVVLVPAGVTVDVDAAVGAGEIRVPVAPRDGAAALDRPVSGLRVDRRVTLEGEPGGGSLDLELTAGFGAISVRQLP